MTPSFYAKLRKFSCRLGVGGLRVEALADSRRRDSEVLAQRAFSPWAEARPAGRSIWWIAFLTKGPLLRHGIASIERANNRSIWIRQPKGTGVIAKRAHLVQIEGKGILFRSRHVPFIRFDDLIPDHWRIIGIHSLIRRPPSEGVPRGGGGWRRGGAGRSGEGAPNLLVAWCAVGRILPQNSTSLQRGDVSDEKVADGAVRIPSSSYFQNRSVGGLPRCLGFYTEGDDRHACGGMHRRAASSSPRPEGRRGV